MALRRLDRTPDHLREADKEEAAAYIAGLARDLSGLAKRRGLPTLAYLLDMARLEAEMTARSKADTAFERSDPAIDVP